MVMEPGKVFLVTAQNSTRTMCTAMATGPSYDLSDVDMVMFNMPFVPDTLQSFLDDRFNPKMWAKWFQEFLEELLGAGRAAIKEARQRHPLLLAKRFWKNCRSGTLPQREWKMKLWKQRLQGV